MGSLPCHSLLVRSTELNVSFLESRGPNLLKSCDLSLWFGSKWGIWKGGKLWVVTQYDILSDESIQYGSYKSYQYDLLLVCSYQFHAPNWGICCWFISGSVLDHWLWIYRQSFGKLFSLFANYYLILLLVWYGILLFLFIEVCVIKFESFSFVQYSDSFEPLPRYTGFSVFGCTGKLISWNYVEVYH